MLIVDGDIPMRWWGHERNFGDLLGPWIASRITQKPIRWVPNHEPHYLTVGSILGHATPASVLWGTGSFGNETMEDVTLGERYLAVRGPLTRAKLEMFKQPVPRVYGDPALLVPMLYPSTVQPSYELGVVLRWSEAKRKEAFQIEGARLIELKTDDIEGTLDAILSCKRIISTSLHGLILADAYGIPNSWLIAETGWGKEHKFWDYLTSVRKEREPDDFDITDAAYDLDSLIEKASFDDREIQLDVKALFETNPFTTSTDRVLTAESLAREGARQMKSSGRVSPGSEIPRYAK